MCSPVYCSLDQTDLPIDYSKFLHSQIIQNILSVGPTFPGQETIFFQFWTHAMILILRPEFLLVDLRDFFSRFRVGGRKKKSSENDQSELFFLTDHFQSFFLISQKKNSKTYMHK